MKLRNNARGRTAPCLDSTSSRTIFCVSRLRFSARASDSERRAFSAAIRSFSATGMELLLPISMLFLSFRTKIGQLHDLVGVQRRVPVVRPVRMKRDGA